MNHFFLITYFCLLLYTAGPLVPSKRNLCGALSPGKYLLWLYSDFIFNSLVMGHGQLEGRGWGRAIQYEDAIVPVSDYRDKMIFIIENLIPGNKVYIETGPKFYLFKLVLLRWKCETQVNSSKPSASTMVISKLHAFVLNVAGFCESIIIRHTCGYFMTSWWRHDVETFSATLVVC